MATKTITITEDAYEILFNKKSDNESFSDVIRKLGSKVRLSDFAGLLSNEEAKNVETKIIESRKLSEKRMERIKKSLQ